MTVTDLTRTLEQALATGRAGTPVAVRWHLVDRVDASADAASAAVERFAALGALSECLLRQPPASLVASANPSGRHLQVLIRFQSGATGVVTVALVPDGQTRLELLLVGNHGIVRLEGGEQFDTASLPKPPVADAWIRACRQSLDSHAAATVLGSE